jgi:glycosyltransferase involved in cell wall biosynthesis
MGWDNANYGATEIIMSPEDETVRALLAAEPERSVHIFSGVVHTPGIYRTLRDALVDPRLKIGLLSEARDWRGLKGRARTVHSFWHERRYRGRIDFVFAIGGNGMEWYRRCGYPDEKLFPFCYVVEPHGQHEENTTVALDPLQPHLVEYREKFHILFTGQLIRRKHVDLLLDAIDKIEGPNWQVSIIGEGKDGERFHRHGARLKFKHNVNFLGLQSNKKARELLADTDLFVLPSRWDGWGAVVNEALMAGVPVICSDWCGASSLIRPGWNGAVFRAGSADDLATVLRTWIGRGKLPPGQREAIRGWSHCIAGPAIARYVLDVAAFVDGGDNARPTPPWTMAN